MTDKRGVVIRLSKVESRVLVIVLRTYEPWDDATRKEMRAMESALVKIQQADPDA